MTSGIERGGRPGGAELAEVLEGLNDLLQLDHDAVGAYEVAREFLEDPEHTQRIEDFQRDHERHIRDLNDLILKLGGVPANEPHASALLKEGIQRMSAAGGDKALLTAWRANELQAVSTYDSYARKAILWPPEAKLLVDRNALDEERHYGWVAEVLGQPDPAEIRLLGRMRERFSPVRPRGGADSATDIRERAAEQLTAAAERLERVGEGDQQPEGMHAHTVRGARVAAKGLAAVAQTLRDPGPLDPREAIEREIRDNPLRGLLGTFAIGFVIGHFLRK